MLILEKIGCRVHGTLLPSQFFYKAKTVLQNKIYLKNENKNKVDDLYYLISWFIIQLQ